MLDTWLLNETPNAYINIPGFKIYRCNHGRGGGICIYVNSLLKINVIKIPSPKQPGVEEVWVSVQCHMLPGIVIRCVYRHPKATVASLKYFQHVFRQLCLFKKSINQSVNGGTRRGAHRHANPTTPNREVPPF